MSGTPQTPSRPTSSPSPPHRHRGVARPCPCPQTGGGGSLGTLPCPAAEGRRWLLHQHLLNDKRQLIIPPCREERGDRAAVTAPGLCPSSGTALVTVSLPKVTGSIPPHGSPCAPLLVQPGGLVTLLRGFGDPLLGGFGGPVTLCRAAAPRPAAARPASPLTH